MTMGCWVSFRGPRWGCCLITFLGEMTLAAGYGAFLWHQAFKVLIRMSVFYMCTQHKHLSKVHWNRCWFHTLWNAIIPLFFIFKVNFGFVKKCCASFEGIGREYGKIYVWCTFVKVDNHGCSKQLLFYDKYMYIVIVEIWLKQTNNKTVWDNKRNL